MQDTTNSPKINTQSPGQHEITHRRVALILRDASRLTPVIDFNAAAMVSTQSSPSRPFKRPSALMHIRVRLRRNAREAWYLHRRVTAVVAVCAIASLSLLAIIIPRQLTELRLLRASNSQRQSAHALANHRNAAPSQYRYDVSAFPPSSSSATIIATIATHAERGGLDIASISSRQTRMESGLLIRTEIEFTAVGSFKNTRTLIANVLEAYPSLALDTLDVLRDDIESSTVSATIQFSYFSQP
mgnify:CR=1 FL=1|jgi:hypothetical protein